LLSVARADPRLIQLGKYGSFPAWNLLGKHYDITYEIAKTADGEAQPAPPEYAPREVQGKVPFGQRLSEKKLKKMNQGGKGLKNEAGQSSTNEEKAKTQPGWNTYLRPLKKRAVAEAIIGAFS
jgi:tRNA (adenine-N(1)-)-methyltransferase non-catalytic subunit